MNTTQKHPRPLASPHEVMAALSDAVSDSSSSYLCEDSGTRATPALIPPGATPVHEKGAGARYAWTAPHHAYMTCLDPAVISCAAEECDWLASPALRIPCSFDRRDEVLEHWIARSSPRPDSVPMPCADWRFSPSSTRWLSA